MSYGDHSERTPQELAKLYGLPEGVVPKFQQLEPASSEELAFIRRTISGGLNSSAQRSETLELTAAGLGRGFHLVSTEQS